MLTPDLSDIGNEKGVGLVAAISTPPFIRPSFPSPAEVAEDFAEILNTNWYTNFGPKEQGFSRALSKYLGSGVEVATFANGTMALIAALTGAFGSGARDRYVLMPSFSFVALAQAAAWAGYRPWFIDINADTWQPSIDSARLVLESSRDHVAGLLIANTFGVGNPQIQAWEDLAAQWELPIVVDSAAGFGSVYADGVRVGVRADCEIFSFHATKPFTIAEGGALVSRDPARIEWARRFQNYGFSDRGCLGLGVNAKLTEIAAAIGLRQLVGLDRRLASRRGVLARYIAELAGAGLQFQPWADASSVCFAGACCESREHKAAVLMSLAGNAIQAHDYYNPPQHGHPYFQANPELIRKTDLTATENLCARIVSLPVHDFMAPDDLSRVISAVKQAGAQ